jgi:hypothetical protein
MHSNSTRWIRLVLAGAWLIATALGSATMAHAASGYHLVRKVMLGGEGGWDYLTLDPSSRRLFISRGTHVMVVDADSGKLDRRRRRKIPDRDRRSCWDPSRCSSTGSDAGATKPHGTGLESGPERWNER